MFLSFSLYDFIPLAAESLIDVCHSIFSTLASKKTNAGKSNIGDWAAAQCPNDFYRMLIDVGYDFECFNCHRCIERFVAKKRDQVIRGNLA